MDSGNSGSLQSSSGGDGGGGGGGGGASANYNPIPILQTPSNFFDPSSLSQPLNPNPNPNPNQMYNLGSLWSRNLNSNPIYEIDSQQDLYLNPIPPDTRPEKLGVVTKNPKKRTRASRRAPTTVLTTDTTNFRQMVQEFTGIPAAPYSAATSSSSNFARRIDPYGGGITPVQTFQPSALSYLNSTNSTTSNFQLPPPETHGFTKQSMNLSNVSNLSNLQNQMFPFQSISQQTTLPHPINVTEREIQRSEAQNAFPSSSSTSLKRWRGENETMMNFEGGNGNTQVTQNAVVSSRSDGDQITGNEDTWLCSSD